MKVVGTAVLSTNVCIFNMHNNVVFAMRVFVSNLELFRFLLSVPSGM